LFFELRLKLDHEAFPFLLVSQILIIERTIAYGKGGNLLGKLFPIPSLGITTVILPLSISFLVNFSTARISVELISGPTN